MTDALDGTSTWPALSSWMTGAREGHPLTQLMAEADATSSPVLRTFNDLLATVQAAEPVRWLSKRRDFRALRSDQQLLDMRAELVVATKMLGAGLGFAFGQHDVPSPDLILDLGLGIEVTAKSPEGIQQLLDVIDVMLEELPGSAVTLRFTEYPIRLTQAVRDSVVARVLAQLQLPPGDRAVFSERVEDGFNGAPITLQVVVLPVPRLENGLRVAFEVDAGPLGSALASVQRSVLSVLDNEQKRKQAASMPTLLAVDVGRLGPGWMRPPRVWAQMLDSTIPASSPFVGLAVFVQSLDRTDCELGLALRSGLPSATQKIIESFSSQLHLEAV